MVEYTVETWDYQGKVYKTTSGQVYEQVGQGWIKRHVSAHVIRKGTLLRRTTRLSRHPPVSGSSRCPWLDRPHTNQGTP